MYTRILVPLDGTPVAEGAIEVAICTAAASRAAIDLVLVHEAVAASATEVAPWNQDRRVTEWEYLDRISRKTSSRTYSHVTHAMLSGDPATKICKRACDVHADLIIMESRTRTGVARALLGSVADKVLQHTGVPVLMLRSKEADKPHTTNARPFERILVPVDGSEQSFRVLQSVSDLAHSYNSHIIIIRIVEPVPLPIADVGPFFALSPSTIDLDATALVRDRALHETERVVDYLERLGNTRIEAHVLTKPSVRSAIAEFAAQNSIDAIAMAVHGRGASRIVVGAIADTVLRRSTLPLLFRNSLAECSADICLKEDALTEQLASLPDPAGRRP